MIYDLRRALDSFRNATLEEFRRDQPGKLVAILEELLTFVSTTMEKDGEPATDLAIRVLRKSSVAWLDLSEGEPHENALVMLLGAKGYLLPSVMWGKIVSDCATFAANRRTVCLKDLAAQYRRYLEADNALPEPSGTRENAVFTGADLPVGKEILLCRLYLGLDEFSGEYEPLSQLVIVQFPRFGDDGSERVSFEADNTVSIFGSKADLLLRAGTVSAIYRTLDQLTGLVDDDDEIQLLSFDFPEDIETSSTAQLHRERLHQAILRNADISYCLRCQLPLGRRKSTLVEIDEADGLRAGMVHDRCLRPRDRIVGEGIDPFFADYPDLAGFDHELWKRCEIGQLLFLQADLMRGDATVVVWDDKPIQAAGGHVVEVFLADGTKRLTKEKRRVERSTAREAEIKAEKIRQCIADAAAKNDPLCLSSFSGLLGRRAHLIEHLAADETLVPVVEVRTRLFDAKTDDTEKSEGQSYAPLVYLRNPEDGMPLVHTGSAILLRNPLSLGTFLDNWRTADVELPPFEPGIFSTDEEFNQFMRWSIANQVCVLVDPLFDAETKLLSRYMRVTSGDACMQEYGGAEDLPNA